MSDILLRRSSAATSMVDIRYVLFITAGRHGHGGGDEAGTS